MIEDTHLDEDARKALASGKAIVREVRGEDGFLHNRQVEPYNSDVGGVIVTYRSVAVAEFSPDIEHKTKIGCDSDLETKDVVQSLAMGVTKIGVWTLDADTERMEWDRRFGEIVGLGDIQPPLTHSEFADCILAEDRARFDQSLAAVINNGEPQDIELRTSPSGRETTWLQMRSVRVIKNGVAMIVGIIADITERKADKARSDFMMRELDHRVKNLLAIILSIAEITARSNGDIDSYKSDFRGRLESMARTHNLLAQTKWGGSDLRSLVEEETNSLAPQGSVKIEGPELEISPVAAQSLAMFLHELMVNALKHGALSFDAGRVSVEWDVETGSGGTLQMVWEETGGPMVLAPGKEGFGGKVINRIVKRQLDAEVQTDWNAEGMKLTVRIPLANIAAQSKGHVSRG